MKRVKVNGVELCVETFGDPADPPVLLVGVTMLSWPDELCAALAGRYVVRDDVRDVDYMTGSAGAVRVAGIRRAGRTGGRRIGLRPGGPYSEGAACEPSGQHVRGHRPPAAAARTARRDHHTDPGGARGRGSVLPAWQRVALAAEIPGATLLTLPGIGQGVPRVTWPDVVDALLRHTA